MHRSKPALIFVFITLLLDVLGFGLLIPVAPRLVAVVLGLPPTGDEHDTSWRVGLLFATYAAMQFIFSPILGSLSDRFGRRPVLLVALFGSGLDYLAATQAPHITHAFGVTAGLSCLFITRAINGISGATIPVCMAYIADVTPPEKRAAGFGIIGAAFGIGFAFGPLIGGTLGNEKTWHWLGFADVTAEQCVTFPYYGAAALTLINWLFGYFVVPESLAPENHRAFSWAKAHAFGALKWLAHHRVVLALAATGFISNLAQFGLHATWVLSMTKRFGWDTFETGASLCVVGLTSGFVQGVLARKIIPRVGERACLMAGLVIGAMAFACYGLATHGWMIYVVIALASIGGVAQPAGQAMSSKGIPPNEQGLLQGANGSLTSIAQIAGPLIGSGIFFAFTTKDGPATLGAGAPFLMGSFLCLLAPIPVLMVWKHLPTAVTRGPDEDAART